MENKSVEVLTIDEVEYLIMDEDDHVVYTAELNNPANVLILKKDGENLIKLNEVESMPYYEKFISKYGTMVEV